MDDDDTFLARWMAVVAVLVALTCWFASTADGREPICATDSRWPCPGEKR